MEWISVKDRLPEQDGEYIVAAKVGDNAFVEQSRFVKDYYGLGPDWRKFASGEVTHWMPMPDFPEE